MRVLPALGGVVVVGQEEYLDSSGRLCHLTRDRVAQAMSTPKGAQTQQPVEEAGGQSQVWLAVRFRTLKSCWVLSRGAAAVRGFECDAGGAEEARDRRALSGEESDACSGTAASWVPHGEDLGSKRAVRGRLQRQSRAGRGGGGGGRWWWWWLMSGRGDAAAVVVVVEAGVEAELEVEVEVVRMIIEVSCLWRTSSSRILGRLGSCEPVWV